MRNVHRDESFNLVGGILERWPMALAAGVDVVRAHLAIPAPRQRRAGRWWGVLVVVRSPRRWWGPMRTDVLVAAAAWELTWSTNDVMSSG